MPFLVLSQSFEKDDRLTRGLAWPHREPKVEPWTGLDLPGTKDCVGMDHQWESCSYFCWILLREASFEGIFDLCKMPQEGLLRELDKLDMFTAKSNKWPFHISNRAKV